jgi:hypothetical protein
MYPFLWRSSDLASKPLLSIVMSTGTTRKAVRKPASMPDRAGRETSWTLCGIQKAERHGLLVAGASHTIPPPARVRKLGVLMQQSCDDCNRSGPVASILGMA